MTTPDPTRVTVVSDPDDEYRWHTGRTPSSPTTS